MGSSGAVGGGAVGYAIDEANLLTEPTVSGNDAIAIGDGASASGHRGVVIGPGASSSDYDSVVMGYQATATNNDCIMIGRGTSESGTGYAIAIGRNVTAYTSAVSIGGLSAADWTGAVSIGHRATVGTALYGIAIGGGQDSITKTSVTGNYGIAIGFDVKVTHDGSIAIGRDYGPLGDGANATSASTTAINEIVLGTANHNTKVAGTFEMLTAGAGVRLASPNGTRYEVTVDDTGNLVTTAI